MKYAMEENNGEYEEDGGMKDGQCLIFKSNEMPVKV